MSVVLHLSDTHFGTERPVVVEALVELAQHERPDLIVLSGDITQRARRVEFRAARAFVDRLGAPLLAIPGNHDIPLLDLRARFLFPYLRQREAFGDDLEPVFGSSDLLVACVDTTRRWRHKNGEVSSLQIERVAGLLARAADAQLRIVVVHQPAAVMREQDRPNRLRGGAAALRRWAASGADLVLGGHIHWPYVLDCEFDIDGAARPLWVVQAGTAVSSRTRPDAPNSVNLIRWGAGSAHGCCVVEQWDFAAADRRFARKASTRVAPSRFKNGR